jgi:hypothetical protein
MLIELRRVVIHRHDPFVGRVLYCAEKLAKPILRQYRKLKMSMFIQTIAGTPSTG